ncbi:MAG: hypothetical protein H6739_41515 [Alphaproteobacteria bacterium]|nr:hypothetical protein [Alphaproteobacteria bacterium]
MSKMYKAFEEMKVFLGFGDDDAAHLAALAPVFARHGPGITDDFYDVLGRTPATAGLIEGRVDALKATHARWMGQLFEGSYGEDYFEGRRRIGEAHVRIGLPPQFVEGVMSFIRTAGERAIRAEIADHDEASAKVASLFKILDLDLIIINLAYGEERVQLMCNITGMSRPLVENLIKQGGRRKK